MLIRLTTLVLAALMVPPLARPRAATAQPPVPADGPASGEFGVVRWTPVPPADESRLPAELEHSGRPIDPNRSPDRQATAGVALRLTQTYPRIRPDASGSATTTLPTPTAAAETLTDRASAERFQSDFSSQMGNYEIGIDLYSPPEFEGGLIVFGDNVAMKLGGYVKADFIHDLDPIDATDSFVTTSIPVGAPDRTNSRFHARQTRLSADTRWTVGNRVAQIFVEGDFFSEGDQFRLRHAYGEVGRLIVGRTWTTFTDVKAAPATLDFEGSVSSVNRRQAQARWTFPLWQDLLTAAVSIENPRIILDLPPAVQGEARTPSPDLIARVRLERDWTQLQIAALTRTLGFQNAQGELITGTAWGWNFSGVALLTDANKTYFQILFGEGIGSYRDLPDTAPTSPTDADLLPVFGWMVGTTHEWNERLSSNFTYAVNRLENSEFQPADELHQVTYLAANLIWTPLERVNLGIEYLYGTRENVGGASSGANRLQAACIFYLP